MHPRFATAFSYCGVTFGPPCVWLDSLRKNHRLNMPCPTHRSNLNRERSSAHRYVHGKGRLLLWMRFLGIILVGHMDHVCIVMRAAHGN